MLAALSTILVKLNVDLVFCMIVVLTDKFADEIS